MNELPGDHAASGSSLPRCLHFIWLDDEIPDNRQACIDSCVVRHPGWDVRIWRSVDEFGLLRNRRAFFGADAIAPPPPAGNRWQIVSNVLRFEIMARFGGVFLDSDVTCLQSIDPLIERCEVEGRAGMLGWEIQDRWLGEAVIACLPGAPFMQKIVDNLEEWAFARRGRPATITVGPQYITPLLLGSAELDEVLVMDQEAFFPARHDQPDLSDAIARGAVSSPQTYLVHRFGNFRRKKEMTWT